jgi:hypothetical protein
VALSFESTGLDVHVLRLTEVMHPGLHVLPQHQFLRVGMQVHLLVYPRYARYKHPVGHRVAAQVVLEPVRSYVSGTISGRSPCR